MLELKVKHLRAYLQAKDISHNTCTEKQELVDLIKHNRHLPFTHLLNQQTTTTMQPPPSPKPGPFTNLQNTVSSFTDQVNNFATNIQDYVSNTVSDVINNTLDDGPNNNNPNRGPSNYSFSSSGSSTQTTNNATANPQQRRAPPSQSASASSTSVDKLNIDLCKKNYLFNFILDNKSTNTSKIS